MFVNAKIVATNANREDYLRDKRERGDPAFEVSSSMLREFSRCPSRWKAGYVSPGSKAREWGNLLDSKFLTPGQFKQHYAVLPEDAPRKPSKTQLNAKKPSPETVAAISWWESFEADHDGAEIITPAQLAEVEHAIHRLRSSEEISSWHESCDTQVWVAADWQDKDTGLLIPCRCLLDYVPREGTEWAKCAGDLKTATSAHPDSFTDAAFRYGYHVQAAFDMDMLVAATGRDITTWVFVISENFPPYEPNFAMYGEDNGAPGFLDMGRDVQFHGYREMLANYAKCLKTGKWPGYNHTDETVQGCCILRPKPFMADKLLYAQNFEFGNAEEGDETETPVMEDLIP